MKQYSIFDYIENDVMEDGCFYQCVSGSNLFIGKCKIYVIKSFINSLGYRQHCYILSLTNDKGESVFYHNYFAKDFIKL